MTCEINIENEGRLQHLQLRKLLEGDIPVIQSLCKEWFPIDYPMYWYVDITTNPKFIALAAVIQEQLVGLLVAELKPQCKCSREDQGLLSRRFSKNTKVAYILTLGVVRQFRRLGIATYLLNHLIQSLTVASASKDCRAIFLHVLTSNQVAIRFYEKTNFHRHRFLPFYYYIDGHSKDGFSYVLYVNGGYGPLCLIDHLQPLLYFFLDESRSFRDLFRCLGKRLQRLTSCLLRPFSSSLTAATTTIHKDKQVKAQLIFC